jgi:hypothetical protein
MQVCAAFDTVAGYGETANASGAAIERLTIPQGVVAGLGGLHVEMSSTAMVGLGEGARYLVEYPYGCAEQKGSRALALLLAADLGDAFTLPGVEPSKMRPAVQQTLKELERFQCSSGGFAYWPGACESVSPYLTAYLLHVFQVAADLKYVVDPGVRDRAYTYLEKSLSQPPPSGTKAGGRHTWRQAFAVKVLVEGGRTQDSSLIGCIDARRMPVFALAYLRCVARKRPVVGPRVDDLRRRMSTRDLAGGPAARTSRTRRPAPLVLELERAVDGVVLNSLVRRTHKRSQSHTDRPVDDGAGGAGAARENACAMESLVNYFRNARPLFGLQRRRDGPDESARQKGRSAGSGVGGFVDAAGAVENAGATLPLTFSREHQHSSRHQASLRRRRDDPAGLDAGSRRAEIRTVCREWNRHRPPPGAGDLVRVTLTLRLTKERRFVAVTDPIPAGFEAVESWFATTAQTIASQQDRQSNPNGSADSWDNWWRFGGFDHVERHDDRVQLFATRLSEGLHEFSYIVRATTAGTFRTAPAHAEEMYEPEVFGRTATAVIEIKR